VNAMKELDIKIPIGILPTGTANDFSNALQISFDIKEAINEIIRAYLLEQQYNNLNPYYLYTH
ncbi:diacylglycerol kinase family protein, partial [Clostridioides difficile]